MSRRNSRTAAAAGFALIRSCGISVSSSCARHALLDGALHAQKSDAVLVLHQFADGPHPAIAEIVDIVDIAAAVAQLNEGFQDRKNVFLAQGAQESSVSNPSRMFIFTRPTDERS